ncbi:MAG: nuclear transport factor 2 family protein [Pseudooceanicola sp.]
MTAQEDIWQVEEILWTGGTDAFRKRLDRECLMAFPGVGVLEGDEILDSLKDAPRWQSVEMDDRHSTGDEDVIVLSYRAVAIRDGDAPYNALCTSTWRRTAKGWRLLQHQHSAPDQTLAAQ